MKIILRFIAVLALFAIYSFKINDRNSKQEEYIKRYVAIAVEEMYRTGIPASITLAQAILESGYGQSDLAIKANNHFGIKCHSWKGKTIYFDDDKKSECFRVYSDAEESFKDHSNFLRYRDRYKFLFDIPVKDYKAWAYGLKKAGYATDSKYPQKLIKYIEDYNLDQYDALTTQEALNISKAYINNKVSRKFYSNLDVTDVIPESPSKLEEVRAYRPKADEEIFFNLNRQLYSNNDVPYIRALEGENISSIARDYDLFEYELRAYNDLQDTDKILVGDIVYLQPKKKNAAKGLEMYVLDNDEESLRAISQRYAVKLSSILKMNGFSADYKPKADDVIILRKKSIFSRVK